MWRTATERKNSAKRRLEMAETLWQWTPHETQAVFFRSEAQIRAAACGRRWGKTESLAYDLATLALDEARAGRDCRQLVVAPTEEQAKILGNETVARLREILEERPEILVPFGGAAGLFLEIREHPSLQITICAKGTDTKRSNNKKFRGRGPALSRILFRTAGRDGRGLRGLWAHRIIVDEAAYVGDTILTEVLLPMLTDVGGELTLASTPAGKSSHFYRTFARGQSAPCQPDTHGVAYAAFQFPTQTNPHVDSAFLGAMADELGELRFAQEYGAEFVDHCGAVFREEDILGCLADNPAVTFASGNLVSDRIPGHVYSIGVDWARKRDFTVVCVLDCTANPARLVGLYRMQGMGWEAQAHTVAAIAVRFAPRRVFTDGNSVGDAVADQLQEAIRAQLTGDGCIPQVERFLFGSETKTRLIDKLTVGLSTRRLRYPNHPTLLSELRGFEYGDSTQSGRPRMSARGSGHDDTVIALALAYQSAPSGAAPSLGFGLMLGSQLGHTRSPILPSESSRFGRTL